MNKMLKNIIGLALGLGILATVIKYFGVNDYFKTFEKINPIWFIPAILFDFLNTFLVVMKTHHVFKKSKIPASFRDVSFITFWGSLIGQMQKGVGLLYNVEAYHKITKIDRKAIFNRISLIYAIGLLSLGIGIVLGLAVFNSVLDPTMMFYLQMILGIFVMLGSLFLLFTFGSSTLRGLKAKILNKTPFIGKTLQKLIADEQYLDKTDAFIVFIYTIGGMIPTALEWLCLSYSLNYPLSFWFCFSSCTIISLANSVPFVPATLGIYDLIMALGFSSVGVPMVTGLVFAMLERLAFIIANSIAVIQPNYVLRAFQKDGITIPYKKHNHDHSISIILPVKDEPYLPQLLTQIDNQVWNKEVHVKTEKGLGNAVKAGIKTSKGELIAIMDADGSHNPKYLPKMADYLYQVNADIVIGSRYLPRAYSEDYVLRKTLSRFYCKLARGILDLPVVDPMSGYLIVRNEVLKDVRLEHEGFKVGLELIVKSKGLYKIVEYPIVFEERKMGYSKADPIQGIKILAFILELFLWNHKTRA